jgi:uncharacterized repeat protein (TIGR03803 family)
MKQLGLILLMLGLAVATPSAHAQTFTTLHLFDTQDDGAFPQGGILLGAHGILYGTTTLPGTVFKIDTKGQESVLRPINGGEGGIHPTGTLIQDAAGNLYGVAEQGSGGAGVVYKLSLKGEETTLFSFQGGLDNENPKGPAGGLVMDQTGLIFGAAQFGSDLRCHIGCGSIFQLDQGGNLVLLHKFTGGSDGASPIGPFVQDADGNLYGVGQAGGDLACPAKFLFAHAGCGVVFKLAKSGELTVLHTFTGGKDGAVPQPGLLLDAAGNLYGATLKGGKKQGGTLFKIAKDGTYTVLHRFGGSDGINPNGGLVADPAGNLYGTAQVGGDGEDGTAFQLSPDGTFKLLHTFEGLEDGAFPLAGLSRDDQGRLYGTTVTDGLIEFVQGGSVFEIVP